MIMNGLVVTPGRPVGDVLDAASPLAGGRMPLRRLPQPPTARRR